MFNLSDSYHLRKYYLKTETVPTQSMMMEKMKPPLAAVYFESMHPQLKQLAGLEPPLKGGGSNWYAPPSLLLKGRNVLKPVKKVYLTQLNRFGIDNIGLELSTKLKEKRKIEKLRMIDLNGEKWKRYIKAKSRKLFEKFSNDAQRNVTEDLKKSVEQFQNILSTSITQAEQLLSDAPMNLFEIKKNETHQKMTEHLRYLVEQQSLKLRDKYDKLLEDDKVRIKCKFLEEIKVHGSETAIKIHDLKINTHLVLGSIRKAVISQRLACQVYVSLKERDECRKLMKLSKSKYQKKMRKSKDKITSQDFRIHHCKDKEKKRQELITLWQKKVQKLLKYLQTFMAYCLINLPERAEFFINLERLLLLQLSEMLENPSADSIIECEPEYMGPVPNPEPFYLLCDKSTIKPLINNDLCPKHCTSSATQLPVVIINKRFMYSACDNFQQYSEKLTQFMYRHTENDIHLEDRHIYEFDVPVKCTSSQQLLELKLESSLQQILQEDLFATQCSMCPFCKASCCLCTLIPLSEPVCDHSPLNLQQLHKEKKAPPNKVATRSLELVHEREPKWESYSKFVETKTCGCSKTIRKQLMEHLPPYMRKMSVYEAPELLNYEKCSTLSMKALVKKARNKTSSSCVKILTSKTCDAGTQYNDEEFESLCKCFSISLADSDSLDAVPNV